MVPDGRVRGGQVEVLEEKRKGFVQVEYLFDPCNFVVGVDDDLPSKLSPVIELLVRRP